MAFQTYLDRLVFPFRINHASKWSGSLDYDPDPRQVGQGAIVLASERTYRARRHDLNAVHSSLQDIEDFFEAVRGSGLGFWLPLHCQGMRIVSGASTQSFTARGTALADRFGQSPEQWIYLQAPDGNAYLRAVESAVASGNNTLVTLSSEEDALPSIPTDQWSASPLLYVRFASDDLEDIKRLRYDAFTFSFSVLELPFEYGTAEDSPASLYLYALGYATDTAEAWQYFTSWGVTVNGTDGKVFANVQIEHGDIQEDAEGAETTLKVIAWQDCPVLDLFPTAENLPLLIKIWKASWDWDTWAETGTRQLLFDGEIRKPNGDGVEITCSCQSGSDLYNRATPCKVKTRTCQARFCDTACTLARATYTIAATVDAIEEDTRFWITVTADQAIPASDWLTLGEVQSADAYNDQPTKYNERRPIQACTDLGSNQYKLQIRTPFHRLEAGDTCYLFHGCLHTQTACKNQTTKAGAAVNNIYNFQGQPLTPIKNPQLTTSVTVSSKK